MGQLYAQCMPTRQSKGGIAFFAIEEVNVNGTCFNVLKFIFGS